MSSLDLKARPATLAYFVLSVLLIISYCVYSYKLFKSAPNTIRLDYLEINKNDLPLTIGRNELAQKKGSRSAEEQHIRLLIDNQQGWQIANIAQSKKVDAPGGGFHSRYLKRFQLKTGDSIKINDQTINVLAADDQLRLQHQDSQQQLLWQGGVDGNIQIDQLGTTTTPNGKLCPEDKKWFASARQWVAAMSQHWQKAENHLFDIGGSVTCLRRWSLVKDNSPLFEPAIAKVYWLNNNYWLAPGTDSQNAVRVKHQNAAEHQGFDQLYLPFIVDNQTNIDKLIIGRTTYPVNLSNQNTLRLSQASGDVWLPDEWQQHLKNHAQQTNNSPQPQMTKASIFGVDAQGLNLGLCLLSLMTTAVLAFRGRLRTDSGVLWLLSLLLLLIGNLVLLQLAIGGLNLRFLGLSLTFLKMTLVSELLLLVLTLMPMAWITYTLNILFKIQQPINHSSTQKNASRYVKPLAFYADVLIILTLAVYFVCLFIQAVSGSEAGMGFFQPVEFSKFIIIFISTRLAAQYYEKRYLAAYQESGKITWRIKQTLYLFLGFALLVALTLIMLALVHDFSPIVLIAVYLLLFTVRILPHPVDGSLNKTGWWVLAGLVFVLSLPVYILANAKLNGLLPSFLMNADRFLVWANPSQYPHSGSQVLGSMTLIADSQAWGKSWFGLNSSQIMQLPAVQDDFIATFLIEHFGYCAGMLLLALQLTFIWQLIRLSNHLLRDKQHDNTLTRQLGYSGSLFCFGFAGLLLAHWLISWSNVLGLLPVMGQPMSMLSIGGSNLILFVVPCLLMCFCFAWLKEQNPQP
ncbi:hypothetical protein JCM14076_26670 [Methylosoma difficile]